MQDSFLELEPVLSYKGKVSCSWKQPEPLIGFKFLIL